MFLFQAGAQAQGKTAGEDSYSQILRAFPINAIKTQYGRLSEEFSKIGSYDKAATVGFFSYMFGAGGAERKTNDAFIVAKTGMSDPSLALKAGGTSVPKEAAELDGSKANFDKAYVALVAADKKLAASPNSKENAQEYLFAYAKYIQTGFDLQSRVQQFDQSGLKGVVNGVTFALDAATLPLLAVGAGEIAAGAKLAFQQGLKTTASQALKAMPKALVQNVLPAAAYSAVETGSEFYKMKDQQGAARKFKENAPEALKMLKTEILKMTMEAKNQGNLDAARQLEGEYRKLTDLSIKSQNNKIDGAELASQFAKSFAIGMVMSAALTAGAPKGKVAKVAEAEEGFIKKPSIEGGIKQPVVKETTIAESIRTPKIKKIKDTKTLMAYLEGQGKGKLSIGAEPNQVNYSTVPQNELFEIKVHIAIPGGKNKEKVAAAVYKELMNSADNIGFGIEYRGKIAKPEDAGRDITLYFNNRQDYEKALPDIMKVSDKLAAFDKNSNFVSHVMDVNKELGGNGNINILEQVTIVNPGDHQRAGNLIDYAGGTNNYARVQVQVGRNNRFGGIAVPETYFQEGTINMSKKQLHDTYTEIVNVDIMPVTKTPGYLVLSPKYLDVAELKVTKPVWDALLNGDVKTYNYAAKKLD